MWMVVVSRRHWSRGQHLSRGFQYLVRIVSLAVFLVALNVVVFILSSAMFARVDLTSEKLYSLDQATRATLANTRKNEQPITLQAFISRDVPRKYVDARKQFAGLLRQYEYFGGKNLQVRFVDVAANSPSEEQAQQLGVTPRNDRSEVGGRIVEQDVYLGALVSSPQGEVAIPFVDDQVSIEYELTHAIATSANKERMAPAQPRPDAATISSSVGPASVMGPSGERGSLSGANPSVAGPSVSAADRATWSAINAW